MKVSDLFETDEWTNNPITLGYLYKKQASACHAFKILANEVKGINTETYAGLSISLENCASDATFINRIKKDIHALKAPAVSLINSFNIMVKAKEAFEKAGGKYSHYYKWDNL